MPGDSLVYGRLGDVFNDVFCFILPRPEFPILVIEAVFKEIVVLRRLGAINKI